MKLAKSVLSGAVAIACAAGSAYAADKPKISFDRLDKNNDGFVSRAEAAGHPDLSKRFKAADKNHDGKLNRAEYLAAMAKKDINTAKRKTDNALDREPRSSTGR